MVRVHYHGTLIDGTVFDSSVERKEPIEHPVNGFVPGWIEALQLMSVGDKWKLALPPAIGYGARANGKIPADLGDAPASIGRSTERRQEIRPRS